MSDDMFLDMLGEQVPTEGLGGDRPTARPRGHRHWEG